MKVFVSNDISEKGVALLREHNDKARIITTPWDELSGSQILAALANSPLLSVSEVEQEQHEHDHDHHDHP